MIDYQDCFEDLRKTTLRHWVDQLPAKIETALRPERWGDIGDWYNVLQQLPQVTTGYSELDQSAVAIGSEYELSEGQKASLKDTLMGLHPWRKGPFDLFGLTIDTEWRSDFKWDRLKDHIQPLNGKRVLDVGCGSGYHCWRMLGAGAEIVLGIDPSPKFVLQFYALKRFLANPPPVHLLPFALEDMPENSGAFDTVFSMGVLYHRRSPIDHLYLLKSCLKKGGELVLETLVCEDSACIDGTGSVLLPEGRYAKMRNVWFLPSPETLTHWVSRCGFSDVKLVDVSTTTTEEQRATPWMTFESLSDFLDPNDPTKTIEGLLAPRRAIVTAKF